MKPIQKRTLLLGALAVVFGVVFYTYIHHPQEKAAVENISFSKPNDELFEAPGKDWSSQGKVEDYFVEQLNMTADEAKEAREKSIDGTVMLRLREESTLEGLIGNLYYYGFIKDKDAFKYALEHTEDTHEGRTSEQNIKIGENTVSLYSYYRVSEDMTAWELADTLLNEPTYFSFDEHNKLFMPTLL